MLIYFDSNYIFSKKKKSNNITVIKMIDGAIDMHGEHFVNKSFCNYWPSQVVL